MKRENCKKQPPLNSDLTGKEAVRKKLDSRKKYKQEENTSSPPSPHNSTFWMVLAGYCSLD